jgi:DNA-directed RNA polymerase alpha subunit
MEKMKRMRFVNLFKEYNEIKAVKEMLQEISHILEPLKEHIDKAQAAREYNLNLDIEELLMSRRLRHLLQKAGMKKIGDLANLTVDELYKYPGVGIRTVREFCYLLEDLGLTPDAQSPELAQIVDEVHAIVAMS